MMKKKYRVYFETSASLSIDVELFDEDIEKADGDPLAAAIEKAEDDLPGDICAQCSGYAQRTFTHSMRWSRELGEWEIATQRKTDDEGNVEFIETSPRLIEDGE